jgi:2-polyprenyl-6-methoxyphenol hydroxylase-like FAD-dependent oxidoreductase
MSTVRKALVIGGGLAGPVAAMALAKAGIEPVVYEARAEGAPVRGGVWGAEIRSDVK